MISKEDAILQFKTIVAGKASWARIAKGQFVEHIAIFLSWALRSALWAVERTRQEFFLSTAINDSSILAHVEDREYLPRKPIAANGTVTITNKGTATVALPIGTAFIGENQLPYMLTETATIAAGQSVDVTVRQAETKIVNHVVTENKAFYQILFDAEDTKSIAGFSLSVNGFPWSYARLFKNTAGTDKAYDQFFSHAGRLGVRFGNGTFGVVPDAGATVLITVELTQGESLLLSGKKLLPVDELMDNAGSEANLSIVAAETITEGAAAEGIAETRTNLHYWPIYDEKLVWKDDYAFFIQRNFPNVLWKRVWGETEEELENGANFFNINRIFFTAYADGVADIGAQILAALYLVNPLNRKFHFRAPLITTFDVTITGKVAKSVVIADAIAEITALLTAKYGQDSLTRDDIVNLKDIYSCVDTTGHFTDRFAQFEVTLTGDTTPATLHQFIVLGNVTINLTYLA